MDGVIWLIEYVSILVIFPIAIFLGLGLLILIISPLVPIVFQVAYWLKYYKYNYLRYIQKLRLVVSPN